MIPNARPAFAPPDIPPEEGDCSVTAVDEVVAAAAAVDVMTAPF